MKKKNQKVFVAMSRRRQGYGGQAGGVRTSQRKRVFVAMSGGVDSSIAAMLLQKEGYDTVGVFMRCWHPNSAPSAVGLRQSESPHPNDCPAERNAEDARRVAEKLAIPFYVWDFEEEYKKRVVEYMIEGYRSGLTPNPDVMCNKEIKFGLFLERALAMGGDYIATGHYVRLRRTRDPNTRMHPNDTNKIRDIRVNSDFSGRFILFEAKDKNKDQSYFLWTLTQKQLKHSLFPIGDYLKPEVRQMARKAGLPTANKKDSQGICFLGKVTLTDFLKNYIPEKRGEVLTTSGNKIGEHSGAHFYTIGQRHLGVNFQFSRLYRDFGRQASNNFQTRGNRKPFYLAEKNVKTNTVVVAEGGDNPALYKKEILLCDINFINLSTSLIPAFAAYSAEVASATKAGKASAGRHANGRIGVLARVRYRQPLALAELTIHNSAFTLVFDKPQKFVAPGQSAVFYLPAVASAKAGSSLEMLGGGVIA